MFNYIYTYFHLFDDLKRVSKGLDLSEVDPSHELYTEDNKKVMG